MQLVNEGYTAHGCEHKQDGNAEAYPDYDAISTA